MATESTTTTAVEPKAPAPKAKKAPKAKTATKAAKAPGKASKKTTKTPVKVEAKKPKEGRAGLTDKERAILELLVKQGPQDKKTLEEKCQASAAVLGAQSKEGLGVQGGGMLGRGLLRPANEGERKESWSRLGFAITAAGRKALEKAKTEG